MVLWRRSNARLRFSGVPPYGDTVDRVAYLTDGSAVLLRQDESEGAPLRGHGPLSGGTPDDLAGARAGAVVGNPKCLRIVPTTSGSERSASTIIGTVRAAVPHGGHGEHLGHASPSTCNTRRRSCSQENLRRRGPGGSADPLALQGLPIMRLYSKRQLNPILT